MGNAENPERGKSLLPAAILVLLPVVYLAALGPIAGLAHRGLIPEGIVNVLNVAYWPVGWIDEKTDFFEQPPGSAYVWYVELFEP
jgi:hypothetical protein